MCVCSHSEGFRGILKVSICKWLSLSPQPEPGASGHPSIVVHCSRAELGCVCGQTDRPRARPCCVLRTQLLTTHSMPLWLEGSKVCEPRDGSRGSKGAQEELNIWHL